MKRTGTDWTEIRSKRKGGRLGGNFEIVEDAIQRAYELCAGLSVDSPDDLYDIVIVERYVYTDDDGRFIKAEQSEERINVIDWSTGKWDNIK